LKLFLLQGEKEKTSNPGGRPDQAFSSNRSLIMYNPRTKSDGDPKAMSKV
jgi:hypothetical protein